MADDLSLLQMIEKNTRVLPKMHEDFTDQYVMIDDHLKAITTMIPEQLKRLSKTIVDVYENAGKPSRGTEAGPSTSGKRSGSSTIDDHDAPADKGSSTSAQTPGQGQRKLSRGEQWRQRANAPRNEADLGWLHFPNTNPTAVDYFDMMSHAAARAGLRRQKSIDTKAQRARLDELKIQYGSDNIPADELEKVKNVVGPDTKLGGLSNAAQTLKSGYITGRMIKGLVNTMLKPSKDARTYAYETGYEGGGSPGPFGIRSPFDSSAMAGYGQKVSQMGFAANNNVTPDQAASIYNNLFSRGWYGGQQTDAMRLTAAQATNQNPWLTQQSGYYDAMDKATRFGATSLSDFNKVMLQLPAAAKAAHVGMQSMLSDMMTMGQENVAQGGTYQQGMQNATAWTQATGMPASMMSQLEKNPLVVGQTFAATGLIPQMQGLASAGQRGQGIFNALDLLNNSIATPASTTTTNAIGLTDTISGQDKKAALISSMLNIPADAVKTLLANQAGMKSGLQVSDLTTSYEHNVDNASGTAAQRQILNGGDWTQFKGILRGAKDGGGHKTFEDWDYYRHQKQHNKDSGLFGLQKGNHLTEAQIHQEAQDKAMYDIQHAGDKEGHFEMRVTPQGAKNVWVGGDPKKVAQDRAKMIRHYQEMNKNEFGTNQDSGPKLIIELGPAAKKMLHLSDPSGQAKANVNAGSAAVALGSALLTNPSPSSLPDLSTASSSGG